MTTILLLLIMAGLVGLLLVVFFLLDRVNEIHNLNLKALPRPLVNGDATFGGLYGKNLWDAMCGIPMPGWDAKKLDPLKQRYELVLQKHIEMLFEDGRVDGLDGLSSPVYCEKIVPTLRGEIQSWMPHEFAGAIYRAGFDRVTLPAEDHDEIRASLDATGESLFSATGVPPNALSKFLMPVLDAPAEDENDASDETKESGDTAESAESNGDVLSLAAPESETHDQDAAAEQADGQAAPDQESTAATDDAADPDQIKEGEPLPIQTDAQAIKATA